MYINVSLPWIGTLNSFSCCPESVSYDRSRCETAANFYHFPGRVFFVKLPKCQESMTYAILVFFRIQFLKNVLAQICTGPGQAWSHIGIMSGTLISVNVRHFFKFLVISSKSCLIMDLTEITVSETAWIVRQFPKLNQLYQIKVHRKIYINDRIGIKAGKRGANSEHIVLRR